MPIIAMITKGANHHDDAEHPKIPLGRLLPRIAMIYTSLYHMVANRRYASPTALISYGYPTITLHLLYFMGILQLLFA